MDVPKPRDLPGLWNLASAACFQPRRERGMETSGLEEALGPPESSRAGPPQP